MSQKTTTRIAWCKDCLADGVKTRRPVVANVPGPRCATHARSWKRRNSERAHARHIESNFELTAEQYRTIYELQNGRCGGCAVATGKARRLAVDHDHELAKTHDHPVDRGCRLCIRGLLCKRCNRYGIPLTLDAIIRALHYLSDPPARKVLR
jgi:hypothetical protein